jgi:hypothetical protein
MRVLKKELRSDADLDSMADFFSVLRTRFAAGTW